MAQELEELLIKVNSDVGNLDGIDSAIKALEGLKQFSDDATKGAESLGKMANAFTEFNKLKGSKNTVEKLKKDVGDLKAMLTDLASYTGNATKAITQLNKLGEALHTFANVGEELKGLDKVVKGINGMIDVLGRLHGLSGGINSVASSLDSLGKGAKNSSKAIKGYSQTNKELKKVAKEKEDIMQDMAKASDTGKADSGIKKQAKDTADAVKSMSSNAGSITKNINDLARLGKALQNFNGLDDNVQTLYDVARGIDTLVTAIEKGKGITENDVKFFSVIKTAIDGLTKENFGWGAVGAATSGIASLITTLKDAEDINPSIIGDVVEEVKKLNGINVKGSISSLHELETVLHLMRGNALDVNSAVEAIENGFGGASRGLYNFRGEMEVIAQDFDETLGNLDFGTFLDQLKQVKALDSTMDSGQFLSGLAYLIDVLHRLQTTDLDRLSVKPLFAMAEGLRRLSEDADIPIIADKLKPLQDVADSLARFLNAIKYSPIASPEFDISVIFDALLAELDRVEQKYGETTNKLKSFGFLIGNLKKMFEAMITETPEIPQNNMFAGLIKQLDQLEQLEGKFKDVSNLLYNIKEVVKLLTSDTTITSSKEVTWTDGLISITNKAPVGVIKDLVDALHIFNDAVNKAIRYEDMARLTSFMRSINDFAKTLSEVDVPQNNIITQIATQVKEFDGLGSKVAGIEEPLKALAKLIYSLRNLWSADAGASYLEKVVNVINNLSLANADVASLKEMIPVLNSFAKLLTSMQGINMDNSLAGLASITNIVGSIKLLADGADDLAKLAPMLNGLKKLIDTANVQVDASTNAIAVVADSLKEYNSLQNAKNVNTTINSVTKAINIANTSVSKDNAITQVADSVKKFDGVPTTLKGLPRILDGIRKAIEIAKESNTVTIDNSNPLVQLARILNGYKVVTDNLKTFPRIINALTKIYELAKENVSFSKDNALIQLNEILAEFGTTTANLKGLDKAIRSILKAVDVAKQLNGKDFNIDADNNPFALVRTQLEGFKDVADDLKGLKSLVDAFRNFIGIFDTTKGFQIDATPITNLVAAVKTAEGTEDAITNLKAIIRGVKEIDKTDPAKLNAAADGMNALAANISAFATGKLQGLADIANAMLKMDKIDLDKFHAMADAIRDITAALGTIQGSNNTIKINLDERGVMSMTENVKYAKYTWDEFVEHLKADLEALTVENFDLSGTTKQLKENLRNAESALKKARGELQRWTESKQKLEQKFPIDVLQQKDAGNYRSVISNYEREAKTVNMLEKAVNDLNAALAAKNGYELDSAGQGYRLLDQYRREYEDLQKLVREYKEAPQNFKGNKSEFKIKYMDEDFQSKAIENAEKRMEDLQKVIGLVMNELEGMPKTMEDFATKTEIETRLLKEQRDEVERINKEMTNAVGGNMQSIGSAIQNMPLLGNLDAIKGLGDILNKMGGMVSSGKLALPFSAETVATIAKVTGTLSTFLGYVGLIATAISALYKTLDKIRTALIDFTKKVFEFSRALMSKVVGAFNAVAGAVGKVVSAVRSGAENLASALRKIGEYGNKVITIFGKVGSALTKVAPAIKSILSLVTPRIVKTLSQTGFSLKNIVKQSQTLTKLVKNMTRWFSMLTRMLMRRSVTAFINEMKQAFEDLVVFEKNSGDSMLRLNENVSNIFSGLRRGANQWIAAFEPLINALTPTILNFLNGLQAMGENVAKFMAILTGQPYYIRAKQFYEDYGESVEETNKKVKDLTNGLDELNILNDKKDSGSGITPEDMFEKVPVDGSFDGIKIAIQDILDWIKDKLRNIDWDWLKEKARELVRRLMEIINTILRDKEFWQLLGKTVGELVNFLFTILNEAVHDLDWKALGQAIAEFIKNALETIDWALIRDTVVTLAKGLADMWNEIFADKQLWKDIGETIAHVINDVIVAYFDSFAWEFNFKNFAQAISLALKTALEDIDWEQIRHAVEGWTKGITTVINEWASDKKLWEDIGKTIKNAINNIFIEAFKNLANIDFTEIANALKIAIKNALDGIKWDDLKKSLEKIAKDIANAINTFFGDQSFLTQITTALANLSNSLINAIDAFIKTLKGMDIAKAITNALIEGWNKVDWDTVFKIPADAINLLTDAIRGLLDALPDGTSLAQWIVDHLYITYSDIDWEGIKKNIKDIGQKIVDFINGIIGSDNFWNMLGGITTHAIDIVVDFTFNLTKINYADLAERIKNFINQQINTGAIQKIIANLGHVAIELFFTITAVIKGVDWEALGAQIAAGIRDVIDELYRRRLDIKQAIEEAFSSFSKLIQTVLQDLLKSNSFYKLGTVMGNVLLGIINGISIFFDDNTANIIEAIKQFANSLAEFIRTHEDEIVEALNKIIHAICDIIEAFFNNKSALMNEINRILERLDLSYLLKTIFDVFFKKLFAKLANMDAILNSLGGLSGIIRTFVKSFLDKLWEYIINAVKREWERFLANPLGFELTGGGLIGLIMKLFGLKDGKYLDLSALFDGLSFTGLETAWNKFKEKLKGIKDFFASKLSGIKDFFSGLFGGKDKQEVPVELTPTIGDTDKHNLEDVTKDVSLQFEDASLGKITAKTIEVDVFKGTSLEVEDMFAKTLTVTDIIGDTLKVKTIETEKGEGGLGEVLGARREREDGDLTVKNIFAELLEVDTIATDFLAAKETFTELLNADKIVTELLDAKKITTKLLDAKKITTKLLDAKKIITELLEARTKITTPLIEVEDKIATRLLEADRIKLKDSLDINISELDKIAVDLIEAVSLFAHTMIASEGYFDTLNAEAMTAVTLDVALITAETMSLNDIFANTLTVGNINGNISGGTGSTGLDLGYGDYEIKKPEFQKGERWSDISGLVPSAEDFLNGIVENSSKQKPDYYAQYLESIGKNPKKEIQDDLKKNSLQRTNASTSTSKKKEDNLYDSDEANVLEKQKQSSNSSNTGGYPWTFIDDLPLIADYRMAEVYNVIDTWLGRILKLLQSFNVEDFLKDLLELEEVEVNLKGALKLEVFENIEDALKKVIKLLDKLIKDGIKCDCDCECGEMSSVYDDMVKALHDCGFPADDTHLKNNTNAKSKNTKAVEKLNDVVGKLVSTIDRGGLICQCNCNCGADLVKAIQNGLKNITCNCYCQCSCNCGNCAMGGNHSGGTSGGKGGGSTGGGTGTVSIGDEDVPRSATPTTGGSTGGGTGVTKPVNERGTTGGGTGGGTSGGTGRGTGGGSTRGGTGGTSPIGRGGTGGTSPIGRGGTGGTSPIGRGGTGGTTRPIGGGSTGGGSTGGTGNRIFWQNPDGSKATIYALIDGQLVKLSDDLPDDIKQRIMNGDYPLCDAHGNYMSANDRHTMLKYLRNRWGRKNTTGDSTGGGSTGGGTGGLDPIGRTGVNPIDRGGNTGGGGGGTNPSNPNNPSGGSTGGGGGGTNPSTPKNPSGNTGGGGGGTNNPSNPNTPSGNTGGGGGGTNPSNPNIPSGNTGGGGTNPSKPNNPSGGGSTGDNTGNDDNWWEKYSIPDYVFKYKPEDVQSVGYAPTGGINSVTMKDGTEMTLHDYLHGVDGASDYFDKVLTKYGFGGASDTIYADGSGGYGTKENNLVTFYNGREWLVTDDLPDAIKNGILDGSLSLMWNSSTGYHAIGEVGDWRSKEDILNRLRYEWQGGHDGRSSWGSENQVDITSQDVIDASVKSGSSNSSNSSSPSTQTGNNNSSSGTKDNSNNTSSTSTTSPAISRIQDFLANRYKDTDFVYAKDSSGTAIASTLWMEKTDSFWKDEYKNDSATIKGLQRPITYFSIGRETFRGDEAAEAFDYWYKNSFLVKGYQMGGIPNSGELFVARENGTPEFVGSFGGKTAVANNDQIVTAVANGVSMANDRVVNAIESQTNALENTINSKQVDVTIGDRQIAEANHRGIQGLGNKFVD